MTTSELITPAHLARKAIIYVRQSTPQQTLSHQESLRVQYALEQRAVSLGWRPDDVVVIDTDLGVTAASAEHREGFKEVIAGNMDHIPEQAFYMVGNLDEAMQKAEAMKRGEA